VLFFSLLNRDIIGTYTIRYNYGKINHDRENARLQKYKNEMTALKIVLYFLFIFFIYAITIILLDIIIFKPLNIVPRELDILLYGVLPFIIAVIYTIKKIKS
jgi:hypothetical protein